MVHDPANGADVAAGIAAQRFEGVGGGRVEAGDQDGVLGAGPKDADLRGRPGPNWTAAAAGTAPRCR